MIGYFAGKLVKVQQMVGVDQARCLGHSSRDVDWKELLSHSFRGEGLHSKRHGIVLKWL